jgi:DNA-binding CsgD family transcriptional regulator
MTMRDVPFDYWATPSFRGVFGPAGFEEGLTACLFEGGRYTGMLNLSTTSRSHPTSDERELIAEVAPALASVTDVLADLQAVAAVLEAPEAAFAVTASGPPVALPGWPTGDLPERAPQLIGLARRVLASGRPRAALLRHDPQRGWRSVDVVRVRGRAPADGDTAIVAERARAGDDGLTLRELEVLSLLAGGASNPAIARRLHTSPRTVGTHVEHILAKLGTPSRAGAAAIAQRDGLLLAGWPAEPG